MGLGTRIQAQEASDEVRPLYDPNTKPPPGADPEYWEKQRDMCRDIADELTRHASLPPSELKNLPDIPDAAIKNCMDTFEIIPTPEVPPATSNPSQASPQAMAMPTPVPGPPLVSVPADNTPANDTETNTPTPAPPQINPPHFSSRLISPSTKGGID
jgi:hypothetical protein